MGPLLRAGYFQFAPRFGERERNLAVVLDGLADFDGDLVVLPELAFTGYHFQSRAELKQLAEDPANSPIITALHDYCRGKRCYLVTGFAERQGSKVFNSALLIGPRGLIHSYRKLHLFNDEKTYFDAGDRPLSVQRIKGVKLGLMVCFDWAFPEVARELTLQGADILCQPANLVLGFCQQAMVTRCIENRVYAITANRYGREQRPHGDLSFTGASQVVAPGGKLLAKAPKSATRLEVVELDVGLARKKAITPRNHLLKDRRPAFYPSLSRIAGSRRTKP